MTLLFKIIGFALIIATTTAIGFLKANELNMRYKKLLNIKKGICQLKEHIRLHSGEIDRLILQCFDEFPINVAHLEKSDIEITDDFFKNIGMTDTKSEYERCELYINLLNNKIEDARIRHHELNRLYKSIGIMSGISVCIFLL